MCKVNRNSNKTEAWEELLYVCVAPVPASGLSSELNLASLPAP